jgi:hypothetical protein
MMSCPLGLLKVLLILIRKSKIGSIKERSNKIKKMSPLKLMNL